MHILYLHQYYITPQQGGAVRSWHVATALVKAGHKVTMLTAHNQPTQTTDMEDGIEVVRLPVHYHHTLNNEDRKAAYIKYALLCSQYIMHHHRFDLIYATSTPLTVAFPALFALKSYSIPFVLEIRDVWPEAAKQAGALNATTERYAKWLERKAYNNASGIVSLSPGITEYLTKQTLGKPIIEITNFADMAYFNIKDKAASNDLIKLVYTGTLGKANGVKQLIAVGKAVESSRYPVSLTIMGKGTMYAEAAEAFATAKKVKVLPESSRAEVAKLLSTAHYSLVLFNADMPILSTTSPNKLFDALASGTPIIVNTDGWQRVLVRETQCGFYLHEGRERHLVADVAEFVLKSGLWRNHSHNARWVARRYSTDSQLPVLVDWIQKLPI